MRVEFYFDYTSPYSYLASSQLDQLMSWGGDLDLRPVFLGGIIKALGSVPPIQQPGHARPAYIMKDMERWAAMYGIPFVFNSNFPVNTLTALRATPFLREHNLLYPFMHKAFHAVWGEGLDLSSPDVLRPIVESLGLSFDAFWAAANTPESKEWLKVETQLALERGVFGVPTFYVDNEQYFGNDRLIFVNRALASHAHQEELRRIEEGGI